MKTRGDFHTKPSWRPNVQCPSQRCKPTFWSWHLDWDYSYDLVLSLRSRQIVWDNYLPQVAVQAQAQQQGGQAAQKTAGEWTKHHKCNYKYQRNTRNRRLSHSKVSRWVNGSQWNERHKDSWIQIVPFTNTNDVINCFKEVNVKCRDFCTWKLKRKDSMVVRFEIPLPSFTSRLVKEMVRWGKLFNCHWI